MISAALDLRNEIGVASIAGDGSFQLVAFAEVFAKRLEEAEAVSNLNIVSLRCTGPRRRRLEMLGYSEDYVEQSLTLLAGRYFGSDETLTMTAAKDVISRATGFIEAASDGWLTENLEPSSREWEYAEYFRAQLASGKVKRIRVILVTDGLMSGRIRTVESEEVVGRRASYEIWDQKRILDAALPDLGSEDILVDFTKWLPDGLPCLVAPGSDSGARTYLSVVPARVLAEVFDEYGSLLLESNVRTFLSARGQVNRGIQTTLAQEPERFLAYNNGLTTTASGIELGQSPAGTTIRRLHRWQIVNGGQTTASLAHFLRADKTRNVDAASIQMKLVTVSDSESSSIVQSVARYANSQNRVSAADLFSTHEFHVRMEQISRRLRAPAKEGEQYRTGWFYERARGQWENDRTARGTSGEMARFDLEWPKSQRITKTDWAKYSYCWDRHPDLVSKGAQSVFADYAVKIDAEWTRGDGRGADTFGDGYFRTTIGQAIMYSSLRSSILKQDWYKESPGYLANIVAYAISRFSLQIEKEFSGERFDFERVWQRQSLSSASLDALIESARLAKEHLNDPRRPQANVTQWAKQQACWERFKVIPLKLSRIVGDDLFSASAASTKAADDRRQRVMDSGFEMIERVLAVSPATWGAVESTPATIPMSPTEKELVRRFGQRRGQVPTERQASALLRLFDRLSEHGLLNRADY